MNMLPTADHCCSPCSEPVTIQIPGPAGTAGTNGAAGAAGKDAFTTTTAGFTVPAEQATVTITVADTSFMAIAQVLFIQTAGHYEVTAIPGGTSVTVKNLENTATAAYTANAAPATVIASGVKICPSGPQGPTGSAAGALLAANNLSDVSTPATARSNLGLGTIATQSAAAVNLTGGVVGVMTDVANAATIRTNIGAQALDADLTALAGLASAADKLPYFTGAAAAALADFTAAGRAILDDADAATQRATLGVNRTLQDVLLYQHQLAAGTAAGTFTSGSWQIVPLNTEVQDTGNHGGLAANVVTLEPGTYRFRGRMNGYQVGNFQCRLWNVTTAAVIAYGTNDTAAAADTSQGMSEVEGRFTIAVATQVRLEAQCQTTKATDGFGLQNAFGGTQVYASLRFEREAS